MTPAERCDEIVKLIDDVLSEIQPTSGSVELKGTEGDEPIAFVTLPDGLTKRAGAA